MSFFNIYYYIIYLSYFNSLINFDIMLYMCVTVLVLGWTYSVVQGAQLELLSCGNYRSVVFMQE